jgi:hypothetical protein
MALFSDQLFDSEELDFILSVSFSYCKYGWPEKRWKLASKPFVCRN